MATNTVRTLTIASALLAALAACNSNPAPWGSADQGVMSSTDRTALNAPYYLGADQNHQRSKGGGGN